MNSSEELNVKDLLAESAIVDEKDIPSVIEKLSSMDVDPNQVNSFDEEELIEGDEVLFDENTIDDEIESFANGFTGESSLKVYLREVAMVSKMYPVLSKEEELVLAEKAKKGSSYAREKLINSNLRLVIYNAKKFINKGVAFEDLIQEGNEGLCMAVDKFDIKKNFRFSTYATWWILQRIRKCVIAKDGIIRIPPHIIYKAQKISQAQEKFKKENKRPATKEELSELCQLPVKTVETVLNIPSCNMILDSKVDDDSDTSIGDILVNENEVSVAEEVDNRMLAEKLREAMSVLDKREKYVITQRFMYHKSLQKIGDELGGLCRERIRQIQNEALNKLQTNNKEEILPFLDRCTDSKGK